MIIQIAKALLPATLRQRLKRILQGDAYQPPVGNVHFGDLRRTRPLDSNFGSTRGQPIDRYYIEQFLNENVQDIQGRVLEIKDSTYAEQFGNNQAMKIDVLDINPDNSKATIIADLSDADHLTDNVYDCAIVTQTLLLIFDVHSALKTLHRILKPGGSLLVTVPGISKVAYEELGHTWYWAFTEASLQQLLKETFPGATPEIRTYGNVFSSASFLYGIATEELQRSELDQHDPAYPVTIAARIVKQK